MALSAAERQKNRRDRLRQEEKISVRLHLSFRLHSSLKRHAARKGISMQAHIIKILSRAGK